MSILHRLIPNEHELSAMSRELPRVLIRRVRLIRRFTLLSIACVAGWMLARSVDCLMRAFFGQVTDLDYWLSIPIFFINAWIVYEMAIAERVYSRFKL